MPTNAAAGSDSAPSSAPPTSPAREALDRFSAFRITYVAIVAALLLYVGTVLAFEFYLRAHFEKVVSESLESGSRLNSAVMRIKTNLDRAVTASNWTRIWEVQTSIMVIAKDQRTFLYINGYIPNLEVPTTREALILENERLLPATGIVQVSVPHNTLLSNTILLFYATLLVVTLFLYNRRVVTLENRVIDEALEQRDLAARRAEKIGREIELVRQRANALEPVDRTLREEVSKLQTQRKLLEDQLAALAAREHELRDKADAAVRLEQEGNALEELLEEASTDLLAKDEEIRELERELKRAIKDGGSRTKTKDTESLARRLQILYPNIEVDDRALADIVALRDETIRLRVEECLKRLSEEADNVAHRRKVGGLPNHLTIYEIGFAGKRRIYYTKGKTARLRVLVVGAKNTQDTDLVYLSKIPKNGHPT